MSPSRAARAFRRGFSKPVFCLTLIESPGSAPEHFPIRIFMEHRSGFTLIELLVVIAILAVLAVVVVLTLNPFALLQESRDANRLSDMATLNSAINISLADNPLASG